MIKSFLNRQLLRNLKKFKELVRQAELTLDLETSSGVMAALEYNPATNLFGYFILCSLKDSPYQHVHVFEVQDFTFDKAARKMTVISMNGLVYNFVPLFSKRGFHDVANYRWSQQDYDSVTESVLSSIN